MTTIKTSIGTNGKITPSPHLVGHWLYAPNKVDLATGNLLPDRSSNGNDMLHDGGVNNTSPTFYTANNGRGTFLLPNDVFNASSDVFDISPDKSFLATFRINAPVSGAYISTGTLFSHRPSGGNPGWELSINTSGQLLLILDGETSAVVNTTFTTTAVGAAADLFCAVAMDRTEPRAFAMIGGTRQNSNAAITAQVADPLAGNTPSVIGGSAPYSDTNGRLDHITGDSDCQVWDMQFYKKSDSFPAWSSSNNKIGMNALMEKLRLNPGSVLSEADWA